MNSRSSIDVVAPPARLGECPLWHQAESRLYWIDIEGRSLHRWDPATGQTSVRNLPGRPGSIALTAEPDRILVAMEHQLLWLNWASEELIHWIDLEPAGTGVRLNDGRVDPAGRFVVGSMFEDPDAGRFEGTLHQVEPDGSTVTLLRDIAVSNGNAFDPVHGKAYFADSPSGNVWSWDYDPASAARTGERLLFDYQSVPGAPDGGTTDSHGCYWSASVFGWAVIRLTPDGRIDRRIEVPVERPTMPCFGGPDLSTMFVTSIGGPDTSAPPPGITPVEPGSLLSLDPGVTGIAEPVVAGPNR